MMRKYPFYGQICSTAARRVPSNVPCNARATFPNMYGSKLVTLQCDQLPDRSMLNIQFEPRLAVYCTSPKLEISMTCGTDY